jgi:hypothetical protein
MTISLTNCLFYGAAAFATLSVVTGLAVHAALFALVAATYGMLVDSYHKGELR